MRADPGRRAVLSGAPFQTMLINRLRHDSPAACVREPELSPVHGAVLEAMRADGVPWNEQVIVRMRESELSRISPWHGRPARASGVKRRNGARLQIESSPAWARRGSTELAEGPCHREARTSIEETAMKTQFHFTRAVALALTLILIATFCLQRASVPTPPVEIGTADRQDSEFGRAGRTAPVCPGPDVSGRHVAGLERLALHSSRPGRRLGGRQVARIFNSVRPGLRRVGRSSVPYWRWSRCLHDSACAAAPGRLDQRPLVRPADARRLAGDPSADGHPEHGKPYRFDVVFPSALLHRGADLIEITNDKGSWMLYDWLGMQATPGTRLTKLDSFTTAQASEIRGLIRRRASSGSRSS